MTVWPSAARSTSPAMTPETVPPMAPDQVLPGEIFGASFRSADPAADEIGQDVGAPDHGEEKQGWRPARPVRRPGSRSRQARQAGIAETEGTRAPSCAAAPAPSAPRRRPPARLPNFAHAHDDAAGEQDLRSQPTMKPARSLSRIAVIVVHS